MLRAVVERGVDAIVLVGTDHSATVFELARQYGLPYVLTWSRDEAQYKHCVGFSYHEAAYRMGSLVAEYGHRRIALCVGAALKASGLELRPDWIVEQPFSFEGGRAAVAQLMTDPQPPTVLICGSDLHAVGALSECRARGIRVPEDLSITGSDDIELATLVEPALTTVRVPTVEIGVRAARRIVGLIEGTEMADEPALETSLVVRDSLRRIGKGKAAQARLPRGSTAVTSPG